MALRRLAWGTLTVLSLTFALGGAAAAEGGQLPPDAAAQGAVVLLALVLLTVLGSFLAWGYGACSQDTMAAVAFGSIGMAAVAVLGGVGGALAAAEVGWTAFAAGLACASACGTALVADCLLA